MAMRVSDEIRDMIKDEFIFDNQKHIEYIALLIKKYYHSKTTLEDKDIVSILDVQDDVLLDMSANILFTFATIPVGALPLQTIAGMIVSFLTGSDKIDNRAKAMHCALELLIDMEPYVEVYESQNGHLMCNSMISDEDLIMKNIAKPLLRPTDQHKTLGKFNWNLVESDALYKLNHIPMVIIPIEDIEPEPATGPRYSDGYKKQAELVEKWKWRQELYKEFKDEDIYFNWAADYRGRMYPVGYYYNPQGTELEKNMLGLARGEKLDFHGQQNYKKAIASAWGLDKATDEDKLLWFIEHQDDLQSMRSTAKEQHTFDALLYGWNQFLNGEPVNVPVEFDATNSFAQFAAVLLKDEEIAKTCNVINTTDKDNTIIISDLYQLIADEMSNLMA